MMQPKPTHFVLNIGFWPFSDAFASQMPLVVRALRSVAMHVVWRETSQPSAGNFRPKLTFDAWTSKQHPIQRIDALMYSRLCNTSSLRLTTPHDEGRTDAMTSSPAQQREGAGPEVPFSPPSNQPLLSTPAEPLCHYFSIPQIPGTPPNKLIEPDMLLGDAVHPLPFQYKFWNAKLWLLLMTLGVR